MKFVQVVKKVSLVIRSIVKYAKFVSIIVNTAEFFNKEVEREFPETALTAKELENL